MDWDDKEPRANRSPRDYNHQEPVSQNDIKIISRTFDKYIDEKRKARRWGTFFKIVAMFYIGILVTSLAGIGIPIGTFSSKKIAALVDVSGVIESKGEASAENIMIGLNEAFKHPKTVGVIIRLNTPGGSPVQAGQIHDEIIRLKAEFPHIPTVALIEDICASGGYYVAVAADYIYANRASMVGSIGVRMDSFGLAGAIKKIGIERRSITAGENKNFLDPFQPVNSQHQLHAEQMLGEIHNQFKDAVKAGRAGKLDTLDEDSLFSGLVWTGERSAELGLVDELGSLDQVVHEVFAADSVVSFTKMSYSIEGIFNRVVFSLLSQFR